MTERKKIARTTRRVTSAMLDAGASVFSSWDDAVSSAVPPRRRRELAAEVYAAMKDLDIASGRPMSDWQPWATVPKVPFQTVEVCGLSHQSFGSPVQWRRFATWWAVSKGDKRGDHWVGIDDGQTTLIDEPMFWRIPTPLPAELEKKAARSAV